MKIIEKLKSKIVHIKVFAQRTLSYAAIANGIMLLFVFLSSLKQYGIVFDMKKWFPLIIFIGAVGLVLIGYIEDRLGIFMLETGVITKRNPQITGMEEDIKDIKEDIKIIKEQKNETLYPLK